MANSESIELTLEVGAGVGAEAEDVDRLTRQLRGEILDLSEIESVQLVKGSQAPRGTKLGDPVTLGALAVAVLPKFLPKLVEFVQAWVLRGQGRTVKFKGKIAGQQVEFEGTAADCKDILATLQKPPTKKGKPGHRSR
jgi:hypothetical protein